MTTNNISLTEAVEQRDLWLAASRALAVGKSYTIGNRQLARSDATEVREMLSYWQNAIKSLEASAVSGIKNPGVAVAKWT